MREARRWLLHGRVQGVGFRPFVHRLAQQHRLHGFVQNLSGWVKIEAEGEVDALDAFGIALIAAAPPSSRPHVAQTESIPLADFTDFRIHDSQSDNAVDIHVPPDQSLCPDCLREMSSPHDRRYRYPFINCTQCGPRYTLIERMPYDRPHTTMAGFALCAACRAEYEDPTDRRFHAEPVACPQCGPQLEFVAGEERVQGEAALAACIAALRRGDIVAVKGIGGYHLMCDARNAEAIARLREHKNRPHKALALMFRDVEQVCSELVLDTISEAALCDVVRPIVLVPHRKDCGLPKLIAPGLREIGVMLPYSPLHHLLLQAMDSPLVATSANLSGEPVLTDAAEVEARLSSVAEAFLHHDRPIVRPADDAVMRIIAGQPRLIRVGRGIAPVEIDLPFELARPTLAVGGHTKNTIALGWGRRAVLSPHIGDLDSPRSQLVFEQVIADLQRLYGMQVEAVVCDTHPQYASSRWAAQQDLPVHRIWHHHAHASALALEHGADMTWLCFTWDGVGLGEDGTLWGGEALHGRIGGWQRVASLRSFKLPGGDLAARQPWRAAAGVCWETGMERELPIKDVTLVRSVWQRGINSPVTSAAGRLFDAVACLLGLLDAASYEGQAAMLLEQAAAGTMDHIALPMVENGRGELIVDWQPLIVAMLNNDVPVAVRAMQFHQSLAHTIVQQARHIHERQPFEAVGLTGGVFQNKLLAELTVHALQDAGFMVHLPQRFPCNDGGLALGQLAEANQQHG